jgi:hypothetical protein
LLHDLGKVVLAANFDEQYRGAQSLARKQQLPLWQVEKEIFGASHGEIGAYLLGLWGMPLELLEVAALHQHPSRSGSRAFTPLTAVHIANALEYEVNPDKEGLISSKIDEEYLAEVGVLDRLPEWREAVGKRDFSKPEAKPKSSAPVASKSKSGPIPLPKPAVAAGSADKEPLAFEGDKEPDEVSGKSFGTKEWVFAGAVALVVVLAIGWLCAGLLSTHTVRARTENSSISNSTAVDKPLDNVVPVAKAPVQTPSDPVKAAPTPVPHPAAPPIAFSDVKLQGIFFASDSPSAIINGKLVQVNDKFNGISVIEIKSSSVTLEYKNQRKTLTLR